MRRRPAVAFCLSAALLVAACSDDGETTAASTTTPAATTTVKATTTTVKATTTSSTLAPTTSSTSTTSTLAATTTSEALPVPAEPPPPRAAEPKVELGTIEIPKIGVTKSLFEGVTLTTLDHGPGHWPGTAMPGHVGNVVVGGHRTSKDRPFRNIDQLAIGDEVIFNTAEGRFVYKVTKTQIVTPDAIWIIDQTAAFTATLFACHPVGSTRERYIVFLELTNP